MGLSAQDVFKQMRILRADMEEHGCANDEAFDNVMDTLTTMLVEREMLLQEVASLKRTLIKATSGKIQTAAKEEG